MLKLSDVDLRKFGHTIQLAGALYKGEGKTYMVFFPEDQPASGDPWDYQMLRLSRDDWTKFLQQTDGLLTEVVTTSPDGALIKAIARKCERQISQEIAWERYRKDGYRCRYCGNDKVPLTLDHLVLWEDGGPSTLANTLSSCRECNKTRGRTPYRVWIKEDPYYARVSQKLPFAVREDNEALINTLDKIPRGKIKAR